ncbi:MAG: hypothetical protein K6C31_04270 [Bacteroidales bacterium]|nr:hypothetical protein [Bacteroidales bacterium]
MKRLGICILAASLLLTATVSACAQNYRTLRMKAGEYSISLQLLGGGELSNPANQNIVQKALDGRMEPAADEDINDLIRRFALYMSEEIGKDTAIVSESLKGEFTADKGGYRFYRLTGSFVDRGGEERLETADFLLSGDGRMEPFRELDLDSLLATSSPRWDSVRMFSQAASLCKYIPDHGMITDSHFFMTESFYNTLKAAYAVPASSEGIGDEEFLYYFVTGNGGSKPVYKVLDVEMTGEDTAVARIEIRQAWDDRVDEGSAVEKRMDMRLVKGVWLLDDFDGKKAECEAYIARHKSVKD